MRDKGRWSGLETAQHYRVLSETHRLRLAGATSLSGEGSSNWNSELRREDYPTEGSQGHSEVGGRGVVDLTARIGGQLYLEDAQDRIENRSRAELIREQAFRQREALADPRRPRSIEEMQMGIEPYQASAHIKDELWGESQEDSRPKRVWVTTLYLDDALLHST